MIASLPKRLILWHRDKHTQGPHRGAILDPPAFGERKQLFQV